MNAISEILNRRAAPSDTLGEVEWSQRAKNAFATQGITTMAELVYADGKELQSGKNIGATTLREFIRGCLSQHVTPRWIKDVVIVHHPVDFCHRDFVALSGPYASSERWMLELAIAQLGALPWCVVQDESGLTLCRDRSGYVEVEPEE